MLTSRAVCHAGNVNPKPARLRPALPQDWVQAVDDRAADSSTPTSARSIPEVATSTTSRPTAETGFRQLTPRTVPSQGMVAPLVSGGPESAVASTAPSKIAAPTAEAEAPQAADDDMAPEQAASLDEPPQLESDSKEAEAARGGGQSEDRDSVKVQQAAAQNPQGWQHAGLGGSVAPVTPQAAHATPPQPVPETTPQSLPSPGAAPSQDLPAGTAHAEAEHAGGAGPAEDLNHVSNQSGFSGPTRAPAEDDGGATHHTDAAMAAEASAETSSSHSPQDNVPTSAPDTASSAQRFGTEHTAAGLAATQLLDDTKGPALPVDIATGTRSTGDELSGSSSSRAAGRSVPQSAALMSLEAMISPPFELGSSPDSDRFSSYMQSAQAAPPAQSAFQNTGPPDSTARDQFQPDVPTAREPAAAVDTSVGVTFGSRPLGASAPPSAGDMSSDPGFTASQGRRLQRLSSPEVQRQIEQTAAEVQEAVNERGRGQAFGSGDRQGPRTSDALARATGTLRALVAGHIEEAESLSRGLPMHSGEHAHATQQIERFVM